MEEYRLTDSAGRTLLYSGHSGESAKKLAESDGHRIVKVERYEVGYWVVLKHLSQDTK